jgi:hypothetical protein
MSEYLVPWNIYLDSYKQLLQSGDTKALQTYGGAQSTNAISECPIPGLNQAAVLSQVQTKVECDIVDLLVKGDPKTWDTEGEYEITEPAKARQIFFVSPHKPPKYPQHTLEVCSDYEGSKRNATVETVVKNHASHSNNHPNLKVTRAGKVIFDGKAAATTPLTVWAGSPPLEPDNVFSYLSSIFKHFWNVSFSGVE